jgi:hypothetical protein
MIVQFIDASIGTTVYINPTYSKVTLPISHPVQLYDHFIRYQNSLCSIFAMLGFPLGIALV